jgi:hypothetical protein
VKIMPVPIPPPANPLTQLTTYIPMASALLGAAIGGTISWLNLNRQFNQQKERDIAQERKNEKIAINAVAKEIEFNCINLLKLEEYMDDYQMEWIDLKSVDKELVVSKDKWSKHSDLLEFTPELNDMLEDLQYFYYYISNRLADRHLEEKALKGAIATGKKLGKQMNSIVKEQLAK